MKIVSVTTDEYGNDVITYENGTQAVVDPTTGEVTLIGTEGDDNLNGSDGNDTLKLVISDQDLAELGLTAAQVIDFFNSYVDSGKVDFTEIGLNLYVRNYENLDLATHQLVATDDNFTTDEDASVSGNLITGLNGNGSDGNYINGLPNRAV